MFAYAPMKRGKLRLISCEVLLIILLIWFKVGVWRVLIGSSIGLLIVLWVYYEINRQKEHYHMSVFETVSKREWNNMKDAILDIGVLGIYKGKNGRLQGAKVSINKNILEYHIDSIRVGKYGRSDQKRVEGLPELPQESVEKFGMIFHKWNRTHAIPFHYCLSEGDDVQVTFIGSRKLNSGVDVDKGIYFVPYEEYEKKNRLYRANKVEVDTHRNKARRVLQLILDQLDDNKETFSEGIYYLDNDCVDVNELSLVDIESLVTLLILKLGETYSYEYTVDLNYGKKYKGYSGKYDIPDNIDVSLKIYPNNEYVFKFRLEN